ncbi:hypothetical protein DM480_01455 [Sphingomonas sp. FARSPH]|jgi:hypothetical protein|nr:hypothetical protein DM480_01455 [Sphingomonas sp. FARSPH]
MEKQEPLPARGRRGGGAALGLVKGRALLFEMEDILADVRRGRVKAKLPDEEGEITVNWTALYR